VLQLPVVILLQTVLAAIFSHPPFCVLNSASSFVHLPRIVKEPLEDELLLDEDELLEDELEDLPEDPPDEEDEPPEEELEDLPEEPPDEEDEPPEEDDDPPEDELVPESGNGQSFKLFIKIDM
jgi:hypothetical protein